MTTPSIIIPRSELTAEYEEHIGRAVNECFRRGFLTEPEGSLFTWRILKPGEHTRGSRVMVELRWTRKDTGDFRVGIIDPTDLIAAIPFEVIQGREE
jgi:hypothetical protein